MWFDRIDFRDPLQLTEGVYAFLGRYYFRNNANLWFWTLYGNDDPMGWEAVPTQKHKPEFGGRFQFPIPRGEAGVTYHFRNAEFIPPSDTLFSPYPASYPENRMGLDGKWDLGVGLWFEGVVKHNRVAHDIIPEWQAYCNLGMDYTFPFGTGLNLTLEYFRHDSRNNHTEESSHTNFLVMAANYPVGILSNLSAMVYYSVEMQDWYRFINLQRKYDYWSFYLMVFWNPERFTMFMSESGRNLYAGKGMQLMAVVNF
jgi:hypothetical protein